MNERKNSFFFFLGGGYSICILHNRPWKTYLYWFTCSEFNYYPIQGLVGLKHANESNESHNDVMNCDAIWHIQSLMPLNFTNIILIKEKEKVIRQQLPRYKTFLKDGNLISIRASSCRRHKKKKAYTLSWKCVALNFWILGLATRILEHKIYFKILHKIHLGTNKYTCTEAQRG